MRQKNADRAIAVILAACLLVGCGPADRADTKPEETAAAQETAENSETKLPEKGQGNTPRPTLLSTEAAKEEAVTAHVTPYAIAPDLGNVENLWQFYIEDDLAAKLAENGFVVWGDGGSEFYEGYEWNRYSLIPNFVTVDSMMHTYHLYFAYLMKKIEKDYLADGLSELSVKMLENSAKQYETLKGTEWEEAAARNVAYFLVGARLSGAEVPAYDYAEETAVRELAAIESASGVADCVITGEFEDYSQYIPRGYYEGDEQLERYFRTMMWYGRIHFVQEKESLDRSAFLITMAMAEDAESYALWESIYAVTSFFAGASDDSGICEYLPVIREAYGEKISLEDLGGEEEAFDKYHTMTAALAPPQINSVPIMMGEENVIPGFRFMGQRFTLDAAIMQNLIYQNVGEDSSGRKRMLPDVLDVPAALGSDKALEILTEQGAVD